MFLVGNAVSFHAFLERKRSLALAGPKLFLAGKSGVAVLGNNRLSRLAFLLFGRSGVLGVVSNEILFGYAGASGNVRSYLCNE